MNHSFLEQAKDELEKAVLHYEGRKAGLGEEFAQEVEVAIQKIRDFPDAWPLISKDVRCCLTRRFPYGIVYRIRRGKS